MTDQKIQIGCVTAERVPTHKGERFRVTVAGNESVALDAIQLESIAWQNHETLTSFLGLNEKVDEPVIAASVTDTGNSVRIANEYTLVELTAQTTQAGERIHVESLKLGYNTNLGESVLAGIAKTKGVEFRSFLKEPFGPGNDETHSH